MKTRNLTMIVQKLVLEELSVQKCLEKKMERQNKRFQYDLGHLSGSW
jgi:hypothetical protein